MQQSSKEPQFSDNPVTQADADSLFEDFRTFGSPVISIRVGDLSFPIPQEVADSLDLRNGQVVNEEQLEAVCRATEFWIDV